MFEKWLVPALSTVLSFLLLLGALGALGFLLLRTAIPCTQESGLYVFAQLALPVACLASGIWLAWLKFRPRSASFLIAIAIAATANRAVRRRGGSRRRGTA